MTHHRHAQTSRRPTAQRFRARPPAAVAAKRPTIRVQEDRHAAPLRRMGRSLWPFRKYYATGLTISVAMTLLDYTGPMFIQHIINYASGKTGVTPVKTHIVWVVALWMCVAGVALILDRFRILTFTNAGERVQFATRRQMFEQLRHLSMSFYDRNKLGRIISRCTSDVNAMREVNVWGINHIVIWSLQIIISAGFLIYTDWRLFCRSRGFGPVLFVANRIYLTRKLRTCGRRVREGFTRVSTNLAENITGIRVVTAFNQQDTNVGKFNTLQVENTANNMHAASRERHLPTAAATGWLHRQGDDPGVQRVPRRAGADRHRRRRGIAAVSGPVHGSDRRIRQLLQPAACNRWPARARVRAAGPEARRAGRRRSQPLPPISGHVKFEDVVFGYNADRPVLHGVSFECRPGQTIALVGATGSGKSSIISLIARFYQPQQGRVLVDGHDIRNVTGESLHKQMGLVLQVNYLFTGTVLENIRYARPDATLEQVIEAAKSLGTHEAIASLQDG